ncbi:hypothetical protein WI80_08020 [Burkholderia ubonensis]|nr:hypothetical protein WI80_08020 [Burkholderia ubonensis]KVD31106.1 hypothetical protein WI83_17620 [Burkholderia ubonensis]KVP43939.1 hypothetical protein WJ87_31555 [Burkholderia ubonensis]KVP44086.1 hypothetical protein WJ89_11050 [Burkholderia ubonensis]KVP73429.1 hypothetical protein WJ93_11785 [Burkholderia ubonensis]
MQGISSQDYFETSDGAVRIWIEQGSSIHIKAVTKENDPVELSEAEALEIAEVLKQFASRI